MFRIISISNRIVEYLEKENELKEDKLIYLYSTRLMIFNIIGTAILLFIGVLTDKKMVVMDVIKVK